MEKAKPSGIKARHGKLRIKVIGVGGAGGSSVNDMSGALVTPASPTKELVSKEKLKTAEPRRSLMLSAINTDAQALEICCAAEKLQIGLRVTHGLGAGGDPLVGRAAAEDSAEELCAMVRGADIVVVIAGMGGGTGTGASPLVARLAREEGAVVMGLVTLPFEFEGERRRQQALEGVETLRNEADAVIAVSNDKLFRFVDSNANVTEAFRQSNEILSQVVRALEQLLSTTGLINLDFADLRAVLKKPQAQTLFGFGEGRGEKKASQAIAAVFASPLLEGGSQLEGVEEMLVSIVGGKDLTYADTQEVMNQLSRHVSERTHIMLGAAIEEELAGVMQVTVIASSGGGAANVLSTANVKPVISKNVVQNKSAEKRSTEKVGVEPVNISFSTSTGGKSNFVKPSAPANREHDGVIRISAGETGTIGMPVPIDRPQKQPVAPPPPPLSAPARTEIISSATEPVKTEKPNKTAAPKSRQGSLPLELEVKGWFGKGEPTLYEGEDLDIPTFLRRGIKV